MKPLQPKEKAGVFAANAAATQVFMTIEKDSPSPELDQAKEELREGIENSREFVRKSRVLIELAETDLPPPPDADDEIAD